MKIKIITQDSTTAFDINDRTISEIIECDYFEKDKNNISFFQNSEIKKIKYYFADTYYKLYEFKNDEYELIDKHECNKNIEIKLELFSLNLYNLSQEIERRDRISTMNLNDFRAYIKPESEYTNGNSGRNEHGTHIHIKSKDSTRYAELDILTKKIIGNLTHSEKNKILSKFDNIDVKNEILEIWNKNRNNKIELDQNKNIILSI